MAESTSIKKRGAWRIKLEPRLEESPAWFPVVVSLGAVVVALFLGGIVIPVEGGNPLA